MFCFKCMSLDEVNLAPFCQDNMFDWNIPVCRWFFKVFQWDVEYHKYWNFPIFNCATPFGWILVNLFWEICLYASILNDSNVNNVIWDNIYHKIRYNNLLIVNRKSSQVFQISGKTSRGGKFFRWLLPSSYHNQKIYLHKAITEYIIQYFKPSQTVASKYW